MRCKDGEWVLMCRLCFPQLRNRSEWEDRGRKYTYIIIVRFVFRTSIYQTDAHTILSSLFCVSVTGSIVAEYVQTFTQLKQPFAPDMGRRQSPSIASSSFSEEKKNPV